MILSAIAAMAKNRVIGQNGTLPWDLPEDMKFFRDTTKGHIMIMGRKTFESFSGPLPKRLHVVITRQKDYAPEGAHVFQNIDEAVAFCRTQTAQWGDEVFIVGGAEIYKQMLPITDRIYMTEIHRNFPGDTFFPEFSSDIFKEVKREERREPLPFDFVVYQKT